MIQGIYRDVLFSIQKEEQKIGLDTTNVIEESYHMTIFLRDLLSEVKKNVLQGGFTNESEEIDFFKNIKPQILGKLI